MSRQFHRLRRMRVYFSNGAFTLIEVTLSLATIAIAITAIIGLLSHVAKVAQTSSSEAVVTAIIGNVSDRLRASSFDEIPCDIRRGDVPFSRSCYFHEDGQWCEATDDADALRKQGVFKCEITGTADRETFIEPDNVNLIVVHLKITWPLGSAGPTPVMHHFDLARY